MGMETRSATIMLRQKIDVAMKGKGTSISRGERALEAMDKRGEFGYDGRQLVGGGSTSGLTGVGD